MINTEQIQIIIDSLEQSGDINLACLAADITRRTYNNWLRDNKQFASAVEEAKAFYKENVTSEWDFVATRFTDNLLKGRVTRTTITRKYARGLDDENDPSQEMTEIYREEREETLAPPRWLLERYLPSVTQDDITVNVNFNGGLNTDLEEDDPEAAELE